MSNKKEKDYGETLSHCVDSLTSFYQELLIKKQIKKEEENRQKIKKSKEKE